jgi:DNA-binding NarL/FixJ family response regulator
MILALVSDLFFSAKIRETAAQLGVPCEIARDPGRLASRAAEAGPSLVIVDMNLRGGDPAEGIRRVRAGAPELPIVAFFQHTDAALHQAAVDAGSSEVLTRGQLSKRLPDLVQSAR